MMIVLIKREKCALVYYSCAHNCVGRCMPACRTNDYRPGSSYLLEGKLYVTSLGHSASRVSPFMFNWTSGAA
jgi:hypothetical protein